MYIRVTDGAGDTVLVNLDRVEDIVIDRTNSKGKKVVRIYFGAEDWIEPEEPMEFFLDMLACEKMLTPA